MNRRDFVKFAAAVPFVGLSGFAFAKDEKTPVVSNRRAKYRQYLSLYADPSTGIMKSFSKLSKLKHNVIALDLALYGDYFKPNNHYLRLYPGFTFCINTVKGKTLEYQYSQNGSPDYKFVPLPIVEKDFNNKFSRIKPEDMTHIRLRCGYHSTFAGDKNVSYYGISLLEEARIARYERGETGNLMRYVRIKEFIECAKAVESYSHIMGGVSGHCSWYC